MKSVSAKLFLAFIGLTSLVLVATLLLARWSFEQGFLDYKKGQEQRRLHGIAQDIAIHYVNNGYAWSDQTDAEFDSVLRKWRPNVRGPGPGPPKNDAFDSQSPILQGAPERKSNLRRPPPPGHDDGRRDGPPPLSHPTGLIDVDGGFVAGVESFASDTHSISVPVMVDGKNVGSLNTIVKAGNLSTLETEFSQQQARASIVISVLSLILAALASWWLVRTLLAPILTMKAGVGHLAKGTYSNRLDSTRSDELGALMADIDRLAETLELNRSSRKRWLADISHELRTPVTILAGELEAIKDGLRPMDLTQVVSLTHEVDRLRHLINDLYELSLSDIGGLRYNYVPINIASQLNLAAAQNQYRIKQAGLSLSCDCQSSVEVSADPNRIEQLFSNLFNNAIAYTDAPGRLQVSIEDHVGHVCIKFEDTAPCANEEALEQMFEPLYREDSSRSRRVAGAGLGLTICRNIVSAHGGLISVHRSKLGGVCIQIELPIAQIL